jgi:hypothetical protein
LNPFLESQPGLLVFFDESYQKASLGRSAFLPASLGLVGLRRSVVASVPICIYPTHLDYAANQADASANHNTTNGSRTVGLDPANRDLFAFANTNTNLDTLTVAFTIIDSHAFAC